MEKILILGKIETVITTALGFEFVQLPRFTTDEDRHDFVLGTLKPKEFDKLIILIDSSDEYDGLRLGLHIRLTLDLHQKRLISLLFVSSDSITVILRNAGIWGRILTTKGCRLGQLSIEAVQAGLEFPALSPAEMGTFLSLVQLRPDETAGRHSLANQWGAYALDKAAGTRALRNNLSLAKARKQLYFKYVEAVNYDSDKLNRPAVTVIDLDKSQMERIDATGKKILLIDDEAEKGWGNVLNALFRTVNPKDNFQIISRKLTGWDSLTENEQKTIIDTGFDLFLIDLRLTGSEEEDTSKPENFSGTNIMRQIKNHNAGNQVIMFTASNKAWNLKALLDYGADGYYVKESPEYNFSEKFSIENFKNFKKETESCLLHSFLKEVWKLHQDIKEHLQDENIRQNYTPEQMKSLNQIVAQTVIAYRLLNFRELQSTSYFVVTYVRILEIWAEMFINIDDDNKTIVLNDGRNLLYCFWDQSISEYKLQPFDSSIKWNSYKSMANQTMAIACQQFSFDVELDKLLLQQIYDLIRKRNDFIHEGKPVALNPQALIGWAKLMKKLMVNL